MNFKIGDIVVWETLRDFKDLNRNIGKVGQVADINSHNKAYPILVVYKDSTESFRSDGYYLHNDHDLGKIRHAYPLEIAIMENELEQN